MSAAYLGSTLMERWVPYDDGALAQSAQRVLEGQLPHRDFVEIYTGGLSYWHALAFRCFGMKLSSLRIALFVLFLLWVPAVYYVAGKLAGPWGAGGITLLAVCWSVPIYSASMPSWYNLFFATFGVAALLRYLERPAPQWLFAAGVCGGISFLAKTAGLYFAAGVLLFFLYREQCLAEERNDSSNRKVVYPAVVIAGLCALIAALFALIGRRLDVADFVHFVLPGSALSVFLMVREAGGFRKGSTNRFSSLSQMVTPFTAGFLFPIAFFLLLYIPSHSLGAFFHGTFVLPLRRLADAAERPPGWIALLTAAGGALLTGLVSLLRGRARLLVSALVFLLFLALLAAAIRNDAAQGIAWPLVQGLIPILALAGVLRLFSFASAQSAEARFASQQMFLLLSVCALCSLIQFPFSNETYFCYVAPLAVLSAAALLRPLANPPRLLLGGCMVFMICMGVLLVRPAAALRTAGSAARHAGRVRMELPRAGNVRVSPEMARLYENLAAVVRQHGARGGILAAPDCPEVYFLTGHENPTPDLFEFFEDAGVYEGRLREVLRTKNITVVVLNHGATYSAPYEEILEGMIASRYAGRLHVGPFEVRWIE